MSTQPRSRCFDPEAIVPISRGSTEAFRTGSWSDVRPEFREKASPCRAACPVGNDIPGALYRASQGDWDGALRAFLEESPLPGVCGRVCYHPCQPDCNRGAMDGAVTIRTVERAAADLGGAEPRLLTEAGRGHPVAVVGSGPAGLAAAYHLARMGHPVRLLEARDRIGGLLAGGLPGYRLPEAAVARDVARLGALGVEIATGTRVDRRGLDDLRGRYAAVFFAPGTWEGQAMGLPGEDQEGVVPALSFLLDAAAQERARGARVVVIGGGNTAMDAARTAIRRGAAEVTVLYRRDLASMPAFEEEREEAAEEGVRFRCLAGPTRFLGDRGRLTGVRFSEMTLVPAGTGRPRPEPVADSEADLPCDLVLLAVGQGLGRELLPEGIEERGGRVWVDELGRTSVPGLFAGGDASPVRAAVADALGSGKRAAVGIHCALVGAAGTERIAAATLGGGSAFSIATLFDPGPGFDPRAVAEAGELAHLIYPDRAPLEAGHRSAAERVKSFEEVALAPSPEAVRAEAERCFYCGTCIECDRCRLYCPDASLFAAGSGVKGFLADAEHCKGCAVCAASCPRDVLRMGQPR